MRSKLLRLEQFTLDGGTQPRTGLDHAVVDQYAESYAADANMPPVIAFYDGNAYWLADGFHRWWGARKAERKTIACEIHEGSQQDAQWYSYAANQTHGKPRTNEDKKNAVKAALLHPNGAKMSDVQIAEYIGVSSNTVLKYRAELESTSQIAKSDSRVGRDGRTTNTANIGKGGAKPQEQPAAPPPAEPEPEEEPEEEPTEAIEPTPPRPPEKPSPGYAALRKIVLAHLKIDKPQPCIAAAWLEGLANEVRGMKVF